MIQIVPPPENDGCLLTYSFDTYPMPLQVSPAGDKKFQHGIITMVVSNTGDETVNCEQIKIILPIGKEAEHLTATPDTISAYVYTNDAAKEWKVSDITGGVLTATPIGKGSGAITSSDSLVFYIYYIQVNKKTGIFYIKVDEKTSNSTSPASCTHSLSKFPHGFLLKDFAAYKEIDQGGKKVLTPITEVDNSGQGEKVILAWKGSSNMRYAIVFRDPEDASEEKVEEIRAGESALTIKDYIRDTTTFRIVAAAGYDKNEVSGSLSTTVVVNKADIKAKSVSSEQVSIRAYQGGSEVGGIVIKGDDEGEGVLLAGILLKSYALTRSQV